MKKKGFTLIELLIVVAIVGILAAIAIPNLLTAMTRARQRRSMADMRTIATAWEARNIDVNRYNAAAAGFGSIDQSIDVYTLESVFVPTYVRHIPKKDGWEQDFACFSDAAWGSAQGAGKYAIISSGADKVFDSSVPPGGTTNFDCDIVFVSGAFVVYPFGIQQQ
jgi:type II secretion system protein G